MIIGIWAEDENRLIGNGDKIPWNIPEDLEFFWCKVEGQKVVCGRKTYQSLKKYGVINKFKQVYVLTRDDHFKRNNKIEKNVKLMAGTLVDSASEIIVPLYKNNKDEDIYVIGGASVYKLFEPYYDKVYMTLIDGLNHDGDTFIDVDIDKMKFVRATKLCNSAEVIEYKSYVSTFLLNRYLSNLYIHSFRISGNPYQIFACLLASFGELSKNIYNRLLFDDDSEFIKSITKNLSEILNLYALYKFRKGKVKNLNFEINWLEKVNKRSLLTDGGILFELAQKLIGENYSDDEVIDQIMLVMINFGIELEDILDIEETGCL